MLDRSSMGARSRVGTDGQDLHSLGAPAHGRLLGPRISSA
jgi:hypothetical protein